MANTTQQPRATKKRADAPISSVQVMFAMILGIGLLLTINFSSRITEGQPVQEEYNRIVNDIARLEREQDDLIALLAYVQSDLYVEEWARDNGKMIRNGEVLVIPVPSGMAIEPTATPVFSPPVQIAAPQDDSWVLWWQMFFDGEPPNF
jgi:cell division protein FtsB